MGEGRPRCGTPNIGVGIGEGSGGKGPQAWDWTPEDDAMVALTHYVDSEHAAGDIIYAKVKHNSESNVAYHVCTVDAVGLPHFTGGVLSTAQVMRSEYFPRAVAMWGDTQRAFTCGTVDTI